MILCHIWKEQEKFLVKHKVRRKIHENPEVGFELPETVKSLNKKLDEHNMAYLVI